MSEQPPNLPSEVSSDGREIWAWGHALSEWSQLQHKRRLLRADLAKSGRECGDCDKWMKSRQCPREHNVNGMSRGPSMAAMICGQFVMSRSSAARHEELTRQLAALSEPVPGEQT